MIVSVIKKCDVLLCCSVYFVDLAREGDFSPVFFLLTQKKPEKKIKVSHLLVLVFFVYFILLSFKSPKQRLRKANLGSTTQNSPPQEGASPRGLREQGNRAFKILGKMEQKENIAENTGTKAAFRGHGTPKSKKKMLLGKTRRILSGRGGHGPPTPLPPEAPTKSGFSLIILYEKYLNVWRQNSDKCNK